MLISVGPDNFYHQIYRCFHVWGRAWVVISLPLVLWFADVGIALWEIWVEATTHVPLTSGPIPTTSSVYWGLIATINIYTTGVCWTFQCSQSVFTPQPV